MFDAFVSYSHGPDTPLARDVENQVARIGGPVYRRAQRRVFRDDSQMTASDDLSRAVLSALNDSRWLVVLLTVRSRQSEWVRREVEHWRTHRSSSTIVVLDVDGALSAPPTPLDVVYPLLDDVPPTQVIPLRSLSATTRTAFQQSLRRAATAVASRLDEVDEDGLQRTVERAHRRRVWAVRLAAVGLVTALAISSVAAVRTRADAAAAARDSRAARARELAVTSEGLQSVDPRVGAVLAATAYRMHPSQITELALSTALVTERRLPPQALGRTAEDPVLALLGTPDGVVAGTARGEVYLWDGTSARAPRRVSRLPAPIVAVLPWGTGAVVVDRDGGYGVVDRSGEHLHGRFALPAGCRLTAGSSAGGYALLGCGDGVVVELALDRAAPVTVVDTGGAITAMGQVADQGLVLTASGSTVRAWHVPRARHGSMVSTPAWSTVVAYPGQIPLDITALVVSPDGSAVAVGSGDGLVRILDTRHGVLRLPPYALQGQGHGMGGPVLPVWFRQGKSGQLISVGPDQAVLTWNPANGASPVPGGPVGLSGEPTTTTVTSGGDLVVGHHNGDLIRLQLAAGKGLPPLPAITRQLGRVSTVGASLWGATDQDGLVLWTPDRAIAIYDPRTSAQRRLFPSATRPSLADVAGAGVLATQRTLLLADSDGTVQGYSLVDGRRVIPAVRVGHRIVGMAANQTGPTSWAAVVLDQRSPESSLLTSGSSAPVRLSTRRTAAVVTAAVLPSGTVVSQDAAGVLDSFSGREPHARQAEYTPTRGGRLEFVAGSDLVALVEDGGTIDLLDPVTLTRRHQVHALGGDVLALAQFGEHLIITEWQRGASMVDLNEHDFMTQPETVRVAEGVDAVTNLVVWHGLRVGVFSDGRVVAFDDDPEDWVRQVCRWVDGAVRERDLAAYHLDQGDVPCLVR